MRATWMSTVLLLSACSVFKDGTASGKVESKGDIGDWVFEKGKCFSGQREQYFGLIAVGPEGSGIAIKLVKDSVKGWTAVVNRPETCKAAAEKADCRAIMLTREQCSTFEIDVDTTNVTVNDIKVVEGSLNLDCRAGESYLKGKLTFDHCH